MMKYLRYLLAPFGILYKLITQVRNCAYDQKWIQAYKAPIPVIAIGNLSTGGTGKTPLTEYLIRLLSDRYQIAVLSRGYRRKSKGFVLAETDTRVEDIGDEPFQFFKKFKNITVAVDTNRENGIRNILRLRSPQIILLDDAYQHRKVKASAYILLTTYGDLYTDDWILPAGNLRESISGARRADAIIVTKCPEGMSQSEMSDIVNKIAPLPSQQVFFTYIHYDQWVYSDQSRKTVSEIKSTPKALLAGIAKPEPFFNFLKGGQDVFLKFPDHHNFQDKEIEDIIRKASGKIIVTTEKDYVRVKGRFLSEQLFYLPIKTSFLKDKEQFDMMVLDWVSELKNEKIS